MKLLHAIADYAPGDLAVSEMISALAHHLPDGWQIHFTSVASFGTVETGFCLAQLALQRPELRAQETLMYVNCAPRKERGAKARRDNEGEGLLFGVLKNGVPLVAVHSGHSLSFVKDDLAELWGVQVDRGGSQFRSRDVFPPIVGQVAAGDLSFTKLAYDPQRLDDPPHGVIGYRDSFGNLKTTYRDGDAKLAQLREGELWELRIGDRVKPVRIATGSFNVEEGETAFSPGSSGHQRRFWEVFKRGASAWADFGQPTIGAPIEIGGKLGSA